MNNKKITKSPKLYSPQWFIKELSAIPASKWTINKRDDDKGHHCVLGLVDRIDGRATDQLGRLFDYTNDGLGFIAKINNGPNDKGSAYLEKDNSYLKYFKFKTPKTRVLAALKDLIK